MDTHNRVFWQEFIELYKDNSCLWDVNCSDYGNKSKRNVSYEILLRKLKEVNRSATVDILKKRINNMRTAFRRELKKVQESIDSGSGNIYIPTLWYYDFLLFIVQSETGANGTSDNNERVKEEIEQIDENDVESIENEEDPLFFSEMPVNCKETSISPVDISFTASQVKRPVSNISTIQERKHSLRRKKVALLNLARRSLRNSEEDEYDVVGKRLAFQLKGMEERQRLIAEKLISDVMFYGRMGKLSEDACINIPDKP